MYFTTSISDDEVQDFFQYELCIHPDTIERLAEEGIERPEDLIEFTADHIKMIAENLRRRGERVPEGDDGHTVPAPPFKFGANAIVRMQNVIDLLKHYDTIAYEQDASMLVYDPLVKNFKSEHDALVERKSKSFATPKIGDAKDIVKWTESFVDLLCKTVGVRNVPLIYVIRPVVEVDFDNEAEIEDGTAYSAQAGSVEQELIDRASHYHPNFKDGNRSVC